MFIKELLKNMRYSCFRRVHIKFLYNSKFDFKAKPLVTNTVVITRVLCTSFSFGFGNKIWDLITYVSVSVIVSVFSKEAFSTSFVSSWVTLLQFWQQHLHLAEKTSDLDVLNTDQATMTHLLSQSNRPSNHKQFSL